MQSIPVEISIRELKLVQNYLNKGKPLNDPSNKECQKVVIRILNELVDSSTIEAVDTYISNFFFENLGIEVEIDPYGENSAVELGENGLVPLTNCGLPELKIDGAYADRVQGGFWDEHTGELEEGYISVDDLNDVLSGMKIGNGIRSIQLKEEKNGKIARLMIDFLN